ncbi:carboxypeptidase D [Tremella mesenterica]|uniref:Pheromone-processing carboxypeptidase KEX1 n=1 Tax=Tremella mesenterica TaxID=5217 RepID=A0A4Q1BKB7_TREME|nr:carboxypeptidase D [Tremella mesenterica]
MDSSTFVSRARVQLPAIYNVTYPNLVKEKEASSSRLARQERQVITLPTAADLFVPSLPGIPDLASHPTHPLNVYAGELPSYPGEGKGGGEGDTGKEAQIFFMMIRARRSAGRQRVIFWFNGGPGCSSFDGSLMEVGPFRTIPASQTTSGQVELRLVEAGWEEFATVVFVDQPPGTGYSFVPTNNYLHELDQASAHLIQFMHNLYHVFPDLKRQDTYLAGESFAGQYIPYFADALLKTSTLPGFDLKGIAIGNGWIDPKQQYQGYVDFAYEKDLIKPGSAEADALEKAMERCQTGIDKYPDDATTPVNIDNCGQVMEMVTEPFQQELNGKKQCMNVYDVRLVDDWPACGMNWPPDLPDVYDFLRRTDVISALHATIKDTAWVECSNRVSSELTMPNSPAAVHLIPGILEKGVHVLMFAGAEDLICNYKGIERMLEHMTWNGATGFEDVPAEGWYFNDTKVGAWQTARNMSYAKIYDASHMVGFDVPAVTDDMILRFMDVDLSLLPGSVASSPSRIGDADRVVVGVSSSTAAGLALLKGGSTPWEAWYNAGSALLILLVLAGIVGAYLYFRRIGRIRRHRLGGVNLRDVEDASAAERVPLGAERIELEAVEQAESYELNDRRRKAAGGLGKGKGKSTDIDGEEDWRQGEENGHGRTVFALEDDDEDEDERMRSI